MSTADSLPVIDLSLPDEQVAQAIGAACRDMGFFYVTQHGIDAELIRSLLHESAAFFALDNDEKLRISMDKGGKAWRGFFPVGQELTSGLPDQKEGLYFGAERNDDDKRPMHGRNLFPERPAKLRELVLQYMAECEQVGQRILSAVAQSLGLPRDTFAARITRDPLTLFRIFHYPPLAGEDQSRLWSVGEHTDYGLLTVLLLDNVPGLEVRSPSGEWIAAPPLENAFVCNIGDMLEKITGGRYRSTPHRVRNVSDRGRLSAPFFLDPGFDSEVRALPGFPVLEENESTRWDGASVHATSGTYGAYIMQKVARVFPQLVGELKSE